MAVAAWLCDEDALGALEPEWTALWRATTDASPFIAPAWLLAWWRAFRPGGLRVLTLRVGGRLAGVLPLYEDGGVLRLLGAGLNDLQDVLLPREALPSAAAALNTLEGEVPGAALDLFDVAEGSALLDLPVPAGWAVEEGAHEACPALPLPAALPPSMERNLRHTRRRAERMGGLRVEAATPETLPILLDALFALHAARWSARGAPGVFADPRVRAFHREAAPALLGAGVLRLYGLHLGDTLAAVHYGLCRGGREPYKYRWGATDRWSRRRILRIPGRAGVGWG